MIEQMTNLQKYFLEQQMRKDAAEASAEREMDNGQKRRASAQQKGMMN